MRLIAPFESYADITDVQQILKSRGFTWEVVEQSSTVAKDEKRPPFNIYVMKVDNFTNSEAEGVLKLEFFNNRLMATWLYPENFPAYRTMIENRYPQLTTGQKAVIGNHTSVEFGIDYEKRNYLIWEDERLRGELNLWINRYT